jgi:hypothetical protein
LFSIKFSGLKEMRATLKEYELRSEWARATAIRLMAEDALKNIRLILFSLKNDEATAYAKSLELCEYTPTSGRKTKIAIRCNPKKVKLEDKADDLTLVYVSAILDRTKNVSPLTNFLAVNSPWTKDTMPAMPPKDAVVHYMVASKEEVKAVKSSIKSKMPSISTKLGQLGVARPKSVGVNKIEAFPYLAMVGIRLEFGLAGYPSKPHWRPSLEKLKRDFRKILDRNKDIKKSMSDVRFKGWNKKLPKLPVIVVKNESANKDFAKKVMVRR